MVVEIAQQVPHVAIHVQWIELHTAMVGQSLSSDRLFYWVSGVAEAVHTAALCLRCWLLKSLVTEEILGRLGGAANSRCVHIEAFNPGRPILRLTERPAV